MDPTTVTKFWNIANACTHAGDGNACTPCMTNALDAVLDVIAGHLNVEVNPGYTAREDGAKFKAFSLILEELQT